MLYCIRNTWSGPADKLFVDGEFFRTKFINHTFAKEWFENQTVTPIMRLVPKNVNSDGNAIVEVYYSTKAEAEEALASTDFSVVPDEFFKDRSAYEKYKLDNGLQIKIELIEKET